MLWLKSCSPSTHHWVCFVVLESFKVLISERRDVWRQAGPKSTITALLRPATTHTWTHLLPSCCNSSLAGGNEATGTGFLILRKSGGRVQSGKETPNTAPSLREKYWAGTNNYTVSLMKSRFWLRATEEVWCWTPLYALMPMSAFSYLSMTYSWFYASLPCMEKHFQSMDRVSSRTWRLRTFLWKKMWHFVAETCIF